MQKSIIGILLGLSCMFSSFSVIASDNLLASFEYPSQKADIEQNVALALMEKQAAIVIDVRTPEEYANDHIDGAYNFPLEQLSSFKELEVLKEKNTPVLLYCRSGRRSGIAMEQLSAQGYKHLMNFGGVLTWQHGFTKDIPSKSFEEAVRNIKPL